MRFDTRVTSVSVGELAFDLEELVSFEASVDRLYEHLASQGRAETLDELCPYFGVCWPAARALARWLVEMQGEAFRGKRVLELGCGLALPSFTAAALGASALATDNHPYVEDFFRRNQARNPSPGARFTLLDWRAPDTQLPEVDWVLASDVLYDAPTADALADFLATNLGKRSRAAIVDPDRPFLERFLDRIEGNGLPAMKHALPPEPNAERLFLVEIAGREE